MTNAESTMLELGATSFWYWNVGAFIFFRQKNVDVGIRKALSHC